MQRNQALVSTMFTIPRKKTTLVPSGFKHNSVWRSKVYGNFCKQEKFFLHWKIPKSYNASFQPRMPECILVISVFQVRNGTQSLGIRRVIAEVSLELEVQAEPYRTQPLLPLMAIRTLSWTQNIPKNGPKSAKLTINPLATQSCCASKTWGCKSGPQGWSLEERRWEPATWESVASLYADPTGKVTQSAGLFHAFVII